MDGRRARIPRQIGSTRAPFLLISRRGSFGRFETGLGAGPRHDWRRRGRRTHRHAPTPAARRLGLCAVVALGSAVFAGRTEVGERRAAAAVVALQTAPAELLSRAPVQLA